MLTLVGINLLRGLDLPGLVAILDADKEAFCAPRPDRTIVALQDTSKLRHPLRRPHHGLMKQAMDETERRRSIQVACLRP